MLLEPRERCVSLIKLWNFPILNSTVTARYLWFAVSMISRQAVFKLRLTGQGFFQILYQSCFKDRLYNFFTTQLRSSAIRIYDKKNQGIYELNFLFLHMAFVYWNIFKIIKTAVCLLTFLSVDIWLKRIRYLLKAWSRIAANSFLPLLLFVGLNLHILWSNLAWVWFPDWALHIASLGGCQGKIPLEWVSSELI